MTPHTAASVHEHWWEQLARRPAVYLTASAILLLLLISPNWKTDPDSIAYLSMARSLAAGRGLLHLGLHQWYYAPLYSVFISPTFWFDGRPFLRISLINIATAWLLVLGTYFWFANYSRRGAALVAALVGINVGLWDVCREPRADTLFSALIIWSALFFARAVRAPEFRRFLGYTATGAVLIVAACCTRQVGIFVTAGFTLAMVIRWFRNQTTLLRVGVALLPGVLATAAVGLLIVHDRHAAKLDHGNAAVTYVDQYRQPDVKLSAQLTDGVRRQIADVGRLLLPGMWGSFAHFGQWLNFNTIIYTLFVIPIAWGWWRLAGRTADPLLWTVPFYGAMFVVWPFDQGTRFNVPMLPVLWASAWTMLGRWPRQRVLIVTIVLGLHVLASLGYLAHDARVVRRRNQALSPMEQLAARVTTHEPVATLGLPAGDLTIWKYLLDRPVVSLGLRDLPVKSDVGWLIVYGNVVIPPEFAVRDTVGELKLCHRRLH